MRDALPSGAGALQSAVRRLARQGAVPARITAVGPVAVLAAPRLDALTAASVGVADRELEGALRALPGEPSPGEPATAAVTAGLRTRGRDDVSPPVGGQDGTRLRRAPASVADPAGSGPDRDRPPFHPISSTDVRSAASPGRSGPVGLEGPRGRAGWTVRSRPTPAGAATDAGALATSLPSLPPAARIGAATPVRRVSAAHVVPTGRPVVTLAPNEASGVQPAASHAASAAAPTAAPRASQTLLRTASDTARAATAGPGGGQAGRRLHGAHPAVPVGDGSGGLADLVRWWNDAPEATAEGAAPSRPTVGVRDGDDAPRAVVVSRSAARVERPDPPVVDSSSPAARASLRDALEEILLAEARASGIEVRP